jgi:hypothetical protein
VKRAVLVAAVGAVLAGSCAGAPAESDAAAVMAAALQRLVAQDNTFGPGHTFTALLVLSSLDPAAGTAQSDAGPGRALTAAERTAIEASLAGLGPLRWIDDADEWRTTDLMPVIEGSAILGVGEPSFDSAGALVPVSLWCGGVCGIWLTMRLALREGAWVVVGTEGDFFIS